MCHISVINEGGDYHENVLDDGMVGSNDDDDGRGGGGSIVNDSR